MIHWHCLQASQLALDLFAAGQAEAEQRGLLLVDTKYELGLDAAGNLLLIDEVHTPDSSRHACPNQVLFSWTGCKGSGQV